MRGQCVRGLEDQPSRQLKRSFALIVYRVPECLIAEALKALEVLGSNEYSCIEVSILKHCFRLLRYYFLEVRSKRECIRSPGIYFNKIQRITLTLHSASSTSTAHSLLDTRSHAWSPAHHLVSEFKSLQHVSESSMPSSRIQTPSRSARMEPWRAVSSVLSSTRREFRFCHAIRSHGMGRAPTTRRHNRHQRFVTATRCKPSTSNCHPQLLHISLEPEFGNLGPIRSSFDTRLLRMWLIAVKRTTRHTYGGWLEPLFLCSTTTRVIDLISEIRWFPKQGDTDVN